MKHYLITDPQFYTSDPQTFLKTLLHVSTQNSVDYICIRDKQTAQYEALAAIVSSHKHLFNDCKLYLHTKSDLASTLGFDGVHLPSHALDEIEKAKQLNLEVIYSAHSLEDALRAQSNGADAITISPIFPTPNKGKPLGLEKLKEINDKISINCFALGGIISKKQIEACEQAGVYGFASIRYFIQ